MTSKRRLDAVFFILVVLLILFITLYSLINLPRLDFSIVMRNDFVVA